MIRTLDHISHIERIVTDSDRRLRACDVRRRTGADVVINGSLFDWGSWKPLCAVKCGGKILSQDPYTYRGLGWNQGDRAFTVTTTRDWDRFDNFISCVFLIHEGEKLNLMPTPDVGRRAARTAIFSTWDGKTHLWCDKRRLTPWQLRDLLWSRGNVRWALMLDGGGSTQLSQAGRHYVYASRRVQNYLCFWEHKPDFEPEGGEPVVEINGWSRKKDGSRKLSTHFKVGEFACKNGTDTVLTAPRLVMLLESIRTHFDRPVRIHSGYRTPEYNEKVNGAAHSQHTYGTAADISIRGVKPAVVGAYARKLMPDWGGVGVYKTFTHIDVREKRADWKGQ